MKNLSVFTQLFTGSLFLILSVSGCSKKDDGAPAAVATQYQMINGYCQDTTTGAPVTSTYCATTTSSYFSWNGTQCTLISNGQNLDSRYCTTNAIAWNGSQCWDSITNTAIDPLYCGQASTTTGTTNPNQCNGIYYMLGNSGYPQYVQCYGSSCSGYSLYQYQTGQLVSCQ